MSRSLRRTIAVPALPLAAIAGTLALSACNDGGSTAASSSAVATTSTSSSAPSPSPSSSSTTTPSPTSTADTALSKACVTSTARVAAATIRWNAALLTKKSSVIRPAAENYRTTAAAVRTTTKSAADKTYTAHIGAVSKDMETLAALSSAGKTASGAALNRDSKALVSYCQGKVLS
ncbi:hypothetical protein [Allobranchiibius sp. GilTou73]|uniref:hypothetical protein n=1 Tax=Allobranchiibius sp. GilTou73 TaxID=2904523 RepID=UPI001F415DAD|nr:hypothetical protein [Allobranchiibius sp. GilTou73]UIJ35768.1 hypothetical protein LVQ62_05125 [Allobranchiibius sp. GilTou73]